MKLVVDIGLSPGWVELFQEHGYEAVHWSEDEERPSRDEYHPFWDKAHPTRVRGRTFWDERHPSRDEARPRLSSTFWTLATSFYRPREELKETARLLR